MGPSRPTEAAVNALHVQKYWGGEWGASRATGATATPTVLDNGLAEAQMTPVMANIPMLKYSGTLEDLDEFERTWNQYVNDSTIGCNKAQRQWFCLSMLPHCVPASVNKQLDDWVQDRKISTWDGMLRAFCKAEVAHFLHHALGHDLVCGGTEQLHWFCSPCITNLWLCPLCRRPHPLCTAPLPRETQAEDLTLHTLRTLIQQNVWDNGAGDSPDVELLDVLTGEDPATPPTRPPWRAPT